jgi:hypothetical protein
MMLTGPQEFAAIRVAEGKLSLPEIAAEAKIHPRTLHKWKALAEFRQVAEYHRHRLAQEAAQAARLPIADKNRRLADLNDLRVRTRKVISARGRTAFPLRPTPKRLAKMTPAQLDELKMLERQWRTGLLCINRHGEAKIDTGAILALAKVNEHAAKELGEYCEKLIVSDPATEKAQQLARLFTPDQLKTIDEWLRHPGPVAPAPTDPGDSGGPARPADAQPGAQDPPVQPHGVPLPGGGGAQPAPVPEAQPVLPGGSGSKVPGVSGWQ